MMKKTLLLFIIFFYSVLVLSQSTIKNDTVERIAKVKYYEKDSVIKFEAETPTLEQISGAPKAFYTYFWEFGDGNYSKEKSPSHTYKKKGDYQVKLWLTNNYDNGKTPATRPKQVSVTKEKARYKDISMLNEESFNLQKNRDPIPNENIVLTLSYKNEKSFVTNGKLFLFYNEKKYKANNFKISDIRTHHGEQQVFEDKTIAYINDIDDNEMLYASTINYYFSKRFTQQDTLKTDLEKTLQEARDYYRNESVIKFDNLNPDEERNIFYTLKTTPEMLKDTSAIISVRGVYVPDSNYKNHNVKNMEMEIVTSHDPNKMVSNGTLLNYRLVRFKTLKYKVKFQNNGEGPARTIRLETDLPKMLDKSTLKIVDMYPKCRICPKEEVSYSCLDTTFTDKKVIFTFKNIYLPGSEQKNVYEKDSTKGFVKYSIKFAKDFHKKKTKSRTAIFFDKNEPIITNYATTRFMPGISIGAKTGYNYFANLPKSKSYFVGATISPFKSYRWYWQAEFLTSKHVFDEELIVKEEILATNQNIEDVKKTTTANSFNNIVAEIPVLIRYNVNNHIGLGVGIQGTINVNEKRKSTIISDFYQRTSQTTTLINSSTENEAKNKSFSTFRKSLLFDATLGFARIGPSLGARYVLDTNTNFNYWQLYAIWKF